MERIFSPCELLLPKNCDMSRWSVVACDQFTSQPEYWDALDAAVGEAPSALRLMLPEAYLDTRDQFGQAEIINAKMREYLASNVFRALPESFVYLERTLSGGAVRRGLVGALDLEAYDYSKTSRSPVRATEGTVAERLPPRVRVRRDAPLEMPHVMVFADDARDRLLGPLSAKKAALPPLYDFELCSGGGYLRGWQVTGEDAETVGASLDALCDPAALTAKYGNAAPAALAVGDGNHSLAAAKRCWEELKPSLSESERETHPSRFSLVELVNIHDAAVTFEPIHRVLFDTDTSGFIPAARAHFPTRPAGDTPHRIRLICGNADETLDVPALTIGELIAASENFCQSWTAAHGGRLDYIHNDDAAETMARRDRCAAILLPRMEKTELFPSIIRTGPFPKKSFSIGRAEDKRYYLECRKIK